MAVEGKAMGTTRWIKEIAQAGEVDNRLTHVEFRVGCKGQESSRRLKQSIVQSADSLTRWQLSTTCPFCESIHILLDSIKMLLQRRRSPLLGSYVTYRYRMPQAGGFGLRIFEAVGEQSGG